MINLCEIKFSTLPYDLYFYDVEVNWTTVIPTEFGDRIDEYGPLDLKIDGTETIPWCVDDTSEFTMGRNGTISLK